MVWRKIEAGQDHLLQYTKRPPVEALAELVWNALDAEADLVEIEIAIDSLGPASREHSFVTEVRVKDNGHGMTLEVADRAFPKLGDSWKLGLNKRSLHNLRILHGSQGRGRFFAYSIGNRAHWSSIYAKESVFHGIEISGNADKIDGFQIDDLGEIQADKTGTEVRINVGQGRPNTALLRDDLHLLIIAKFAPHLLGNPDIQINLNGRPLDVLPLIDGEPIDVPLDIESAELGGYEQPVLTIVDWTDEMKESPGLVLCTADGASLVEVPKTSPPGNIRSTGYARWSGWDAPGVADLHVIPMQHPLVVDSARELLAKHVQERTGAMAATIVAVLREENAYPYPDEASDPVQDAERQIFDLVAVTARTPLSRVSRSQRKMTAQLLQLALQERPESLDLILAEALALSPTERDELADLLKLSTLTSIISAAAEVSKRLDLLMTLRHVIYTPGVASSMREVDQLHPLVKDNVWLFGEGWRLSGSEIGLTNVLRSVVGDDVALEDDLVQQGRQVLLPEGKRGRVDLLLQRTVIGPSERQDRLVVELKRPSVKLGDEELTQVRKYARALTSHPGAGPSHWTFWLVGSEVKTGRESIESELNQKNRQHGHIAETEHFDIHVVTWGELLDRAERNLHFYRDRLNYSASQDDAVERVRRRHEELLPVEPHSAKK